MALVKRDAEAMWLTKGIFTTAYAEMWYPFVGMFGGMGCAFLGAFIASFMGNPVGVVLGLTVWLTLMSVPFWNKFHISSTVTDGYAEYFYTTAQTRYNSRNLVIKYLNLPIEDRALFPTNFVKTLAEPDLSAKQRAALHDAANKIFVRIDKREKAKAELARKRIPVADMVSYMVDSADSVKAEAEVYETHVKEADEFERQLEAR